MPFAHDVPIDRSYWAEPERLLAGSFPGHWEPRQTESRMRSFLGHGIRTFVNLMEEGEQDSEGRPFAPYAPVVERLAAELGVRTRCLRFPIPDVNVPTPARMGEIQDAIDASVAEGAPVYVHCWGGRGRTGTVVGIYLIRRGLATPADFVDVIQRLRCNDPGRGPSPETRKQIAFVQRYTSV